MLFLFHYLRSFLATLSISLTIYECISIHPFITHLHAPLITLARCFVDWIRHCHGSKNCVLIGPKHQHVIKWKPESCSADYTDCQFDLESFHLYCFRWKPLYGSSVGWQDKKLRVGCDCDTVNPHTSYIGFHMVTSRQLQWSSQDCLFPIVGK